MRAAAHVVCFAVLPLIAGCGQKSDADSARTTATPVSAAGAGETAGEMIDPRALGLDVANLPAPPERVRATSLVDAVAELVRLRDEVRDGFAAGDVDRAHGPLHEVGYLLEDIEQLAASPSLDTGVRAEASMAVNDLFRDFGDVDAKLHGDTGKDYADVSEAIDRAVALLQQLAD